MPGLDWLTARPIAHRGLHDNAAGVIENTASAMEAAIAANYSVEADLQISADGEAMVHHDDMLGRLTEGQGELARLTAAELRRVPHKLTRDRMLTLGELCDVLAGRTPLLLELKGYFRADTRLVERTAAVLAGYAGPVAAMSFDPQHLLVLQGTAPGLPRGILAVSSFSHPAWQKLTREQKWSMAYLLHIFRTKPHFIGFSIADLPSPAPLLARWILGLPLLTWTVRTEEERRRAARWADQMVFEGFRP